MKASLRSKFLYSLLGFTLAVGVCAIAWQWQSKALTEKLSVAELKAWCTDLVSGTHNIDIEAAEEQDEVFFVSCGGFF